MSARRIYAVRLKIETPTALEELAVRHGCALVEADGTCNGNVGELLDRIAAGELQVEEPPP